MPGITCALLGVIVTSVYQVWVGMKQQELDVDALQLLFYQAPISSFLMILPISLSTSFDKIPNIWISWSVLDWAIVFLSGVFAWLVNISIYWIIGNTSPVTYPF
ncbi:solute carrier family 35 member E3-like [Ruditapes philippinarum]|uniref:solute carrier family 35 member E3-like n=1 Tax=Ruditapes philippinarum TaxID=129788 RepID=UPI00295A9390|nr:solute carrier family 35 member E3-like [Ruditapes philippinarum]